MEAKTGLKLELTSGQRAMELARPWLLLTIYLALAFAFHPVVIGVPVMGS